MTIELRFEIIDLINRYATAIDTRDWTLFRSVFADEAVIDYGAAVGSWTSPDDFTAFMRQNHDPAGKSLHRMSNTTITGTDPLRASTYGDAIVLEAGNAQGTIGAARYDDEFLRTAEGLRIVRRVTDLVLYTPIAPNLAAAL